MSVQGLTDFLDQVALGQKGRGGRHRNGGGRRETDDGRLRHCGRDGRHGRRYNQPRNRRSKGMV